MPAHEAAKTNRCKTREENKAFSAFAFQPINNHNNKVTLDTTENKSVL